MQPASFVVSRMMTIKSAICRIKIEKARARPTIEFVICTTFSVETNAFEIALRRNDSGRFVVDVDDNIWSRWERNAHWTCCKILCRAEPVVAVCEPPPELALDDDPPTWTPPRRRSTLSLIKLERTSVSGSVSAVSDASSESDESSSSGSTSCSSSSSSFQIRSEEDHQMWWMGLFVYRISSLIFFWVIINWCHP